MTQTTTLYCYVHPNRPTNLRCNRCERPICASCAVRTPTGYRCRECVREQKKVFDTALWYDYVLAFVVAAAGSGLASLLVYLVSMFFYGLFVLILAPGAGVTIGRVVRRLIRNRQSRTLYLTASAGVIAGGLPMLLFLGLPSLTIVFAGGMGTIFTLLPLIWQVVYLFMAVPAAYSQIAGIRIG